MSNFQHYSAGPVQPNARLGQLGLLKLDHFALAIYLKNKELQPRDATDDVAKQSVEEARTLLDELGYVTFGEPDEEEEQTPEVEEGLGLLDDPERDGDITSQLDADEQEVQEELRRLGTTIE